MQATLFSSEKLFAFSDVMVVNPHRIAAIYAELESAVRDHAGIRINMGKTELFSSTGEVSCHLVANTSSSL